MKSQFVSQNSKELHEALSEVLEAFYTNEGNLIPRKDFGPLTSLVFDLKDKLDQVIKDCAGVMVDSRVSTSIGAGTVTGYSFDDKDGKTLGILVYHVTLDDHSLLRFYDYELTVIE